MHQSNCTSGNLGAGSIVRNVSTHRNAPTSKLYFRSNQILKHIIAFMLFLTTCSLTYGQESGAMIEIEGHSGILIPRMTSEDIESIKDPIDGMLVYDSTLDHFFYYSNMSSTWRRISIDEEANSLIVSNLKTTDNGSVPHQPSGQADWNIQGNVGANLYSSDPPLLGTTDRVQMVFITDDSLRMQIMANGDIAIAKSLEINTEGGETINYGPFTVADQSPTLLSGTLTVDQKTQLNAALEVFGATTLNSTLLVDNGSSSEFTGQVLISDQTQSDSAQFSNGALVVAGGVGIGKNLNVGENLAIKGSAAFGGPVDFASQVKFNAIDQSFDLNTGAIVVAGGAAVGKRLNVGEATAIAGDLSINETKFTVEASSGNTAIMGDLQVNTDKFTVDANTGNTDVKGNLKVNGSEFTVDASTGNTYTDGTFTATGQTTLNGNLKVKGSQSYIAEFENLTDANGLKIKIATPQSDNSNNFISFLNGAGQLVGRIEGETIPEMMADPDYFHEKRQRDFDLGSSAIDLAFSTYHLVVAIAETISAGASVTTCAGLGVVVCVPIPSLIVENVAEAIAAGVLEAFVIAKLVITATWRQDWIDKMNEDNGIIYQSGAADYAEYLLRADENEQMTYGDIVGVRGGKVSKNTTNADKVMVVSYNPILLGNMPQVELEHKYEKVAFMGQVPVKVMGKVNIGDYIIAGPYDSGVGVAVSASEITSKQLKKIVGIAWSEAENNQHINMVNVAIGTNVNDNARIVGDLEEKVSSQANELKDLKEQISEIRALIAQNNQGIHFKPTQQPQFKVPNKNSVLNNIEITPDGQVTEVGTEITIGDDGVVYYEITRAHIMQGIESLRISLEDAGIDTENNEIWNRFYNDPSHMEGIIQNVQSKLNKSLAEAKKLNSKN